MFRIAQLFVYPIKSLGGTALSSALVTDRGLQHDRRWMLVDANNRFMTQRETPALALFQTSITTEGIRIDHPSGCHWSLPFQATPAGSTNVRIWNDECPAELVGPDADKWFSDLLSLKCRLVHMPDSTQRPVEKNTDGRITSFSDDYPFLILGQASLDDLNSRLQLPVPVNRFRPNIVFSGGEAFAEDCMAHFRIGEIDFYGVKPCARCVVTTIDQASGRKNKEPLATLSTYRMKNNKVYFAQNLVHNGNGYIHTGDELEVLQQSDPLL
jgi:uncharacterized protein YcbX